jgi:excisionase family DNA binding protein
MPKRIKIAVETAQKNEINSTLNKEEKKTRPDIALDLINRMYPNSINFSIAETAKILSLSYDFIRENIKKGTIKAVKYGDRLMIGISELTRLITDGV